MSTTLGAAVIGSGMAGRSHAAGYRMASAVYASTLPPIALVSIADVNPVFGDLAARRFGFEKAVTDWRDVAADPRVDVVSVVVANHLHREIVTGLLEAGKHVLCEKPLAGELDDARAMVAAAEANAPLARIGFTNRRAPAVNAIKGLIDSGELGPVLHIDAHYWTDYGLNPDAPMSWRYQGGPGSGALADVGSHIIDVAEFLCGQVTHVNGGAFSTVIHERAWPKAAVVGHDHAELSDDRSPVENDDYARFGATFERASGVIQASRISAGHPNTMAFEVFCEAGSASWNLSRPAEFELFLGRDREATRGRQQVLIGPEHPYVAGGLPMDAPANGLGHNESFIYQTRAFLDEVAGVEDPLPRCATFEEGLHNMEINAAVVASAAAHGAEVSVP